MIFYEEDWLELMTSDEREQGILESFFTTKSTISRNNRRDTVSDLIVELVESLELAVSAIARVSK